MTRIWDFTRYRDNMAIISDTGEKLTYDMLNDRMKEVRIPDGHKNLVFILCKNRISCVVFYLSCLLYESVPLMLDFGISREQLEQLINVYRPMYCYVPTERAKEIVNYRCVRRDGEYCLLQEQQGVCYDIYEDLALLLLTSGSTGSRKAVRQSYKNIASNAKAICQYLQITECERAVLSMPLCYTYGLSVLHSHLLMGGTILLTEKSVLQKDFWKFIQEHRGTSLSGVPYTYELLCKIKFDRIDLPSLRYMTQAGGALGEREWRYMQQYTKQSGVAFYVMYGQTEATARISYLPCEKFSDKQGSAGIAIPGDQISIEHGEVVCRGDNVCLGYAMNYTDLEKADEWNGILHTGDMGYVDQEGYLYIQGRMDRYIKVLGKRINMDELQALVSKRMETQVYIIQKKGKIEIVSVNAIEEDLVKDYVRKLGIPGSYVRVRKVEDIPRKNMGKVDYGKL